MSKADDVAHAIAEDQRQARASVATNLAEADPEAAARSVELGNQFGVNPAVVRPNLEDYEQQAQVHVTSELFKNNHNLSAFVASHPLAAETAADDWGQLDRVSQSLGKFNQRDVEDDLVRAPDAYSKLAQRVLVGAAKGAYEGFGAPGESEAGLARPIVGQGPSGYLAWLLFKAAPETISKVFGAGFGAFGGALKETGIGDIPSLRVDVPGVGPIGIEPSRASRDLTAMVEAEVLGLTGRGHISQGLEAAATKIYEDRMAKQWDEAQAIANRYVKEGGTIDDIPAGAHPILDDLKIAKAERDAKNLDEVVAESDKSQTKQRSPEIFEGLPKVQHPDMELGMPAEAAAEVMGTEVRPEEAGTEVQVPLSKYVANVDKETHDAIRDDIRVRPNALTPNEAEELKEHRKAIEAYHGSGAVFEGFKDEAIGTGEGAQAYGYGHYFAESEGVAKNYARAPHAEYDFNHDRAFKDPEFGEQLKGLEDEYVRVTEEIEKSSIFKPMTPGELPNLDAKRYLELDAERKRIIGELAPLEEKARAKYPVGNLYKVRIHADKEKDFLDWDKPRDQQHPEVQKVIDKLLGPVPEHIREDLRNGEDLYRELGESLADRKLTPEEEGWTVIQQTVNDKVTHFGRASNALREAGIKGIKYLDQVSRGVGEGTHNFVVFDPSLIEITHRNDALAAAHNIRQQARLEPMLRLAQELAEKPVREGLPLSVEPPEPPGGKAPPPPAEPPGGPKPIAQPSAFGMSKDRYRRYMDSIEKRNKADEEWLLRKHTELEKQKQTAEWKDNRVRVRNEVLTRAEQSPGFLTYDYLATGHDFNFKLKKVPKLDPTKLTDAQKEILPREWVRKGGIDPDFVARRFGYNSTEHMVQGMKDFLEKKGKMQPQEFLRKTVDDVTDQLMEQTYGNLEKNIEEAAKDHVISDTQMDMLHEQTFDMGVKAGKAFTLSKTDVRRMVEQDLGKRRLGNLSSDDFLAETGKSGRRVELALLKNDPTEAFRHAQAQEYAFIRAKLMRPIEKLRDQTERLLKRIGKMDWQDIRDGNYSPEYVDMIHDSMLKLGYGLRRSIQNLDDSIKARGYTSMDDFVQKHLSDTGNRMPVSDLLSDDGFMSRAKPKSFKDMTVAEFRSVAESLKTLAKNGRDEGLADIRGDKQAITKIIGDMERRNFSRLKERILPTGGKKESKVLDGFKQFRAGSITVESVLHRLDHGEVGGMMKRMFSFPMAEGASTKSKLMKEYNNRLLESLIGVGDLDRAVENKFWTDPNSWKVDPATGKRDPNTGNYIPMTRRNVLGILQHLGNEGNLTKLSEGWGRDNAAIWKWVEDNTTPEDWARAQKIGKIFEDLFAEVEKQEMRINGVIPEKVPLKPFSTRMGDFDGWYHPVEFDKNRPGFGKEKRPDAESLMGQHYSKASVPWRFLNTRTGYIAPVELNLDIIPTRMAQMIHKLAFQEPVMNTAKVFYHKEFERLVKTRLGTHTYDQMVSWLKDIAQGENFNSDLASWGNRTIETLRQNFIGTMIGFNLHTVAKHSITAGFNSVAEAGYSAVAQEALKNILQSKYALRIQKGDIAKAYNSIFSQESDVGRTNWKFAMDSSEFLQTRARDWMERFGPRQEISLRPQGFRETMLALGSNWVAKTDLATAVPTWLATYRKAIEQGSSHGSAVDAADYMVRKAHGSSQVTNLPGVMRGNALARTYGSLYGFFNHMLQKHYEIAWNSKDAVALYKAGDKAEALKYASNAMWGFVHYVMIPAAIEEWVTPHVTGWNAAPLTKAAVVMAGGIASSYIGARDLYHLMVGKGDEVGLIPGMAKTITNVVHDLAQHKMDKEHVGKYIKDSFILAGATKGVTNAAEGRALEFMFRYYNGLEHPRSIFFGKNPLDLTEWPDKQSFVHGLVAGTLKEKRR